MRVWGESLERDALFEVEHVELDLAGGVALAQGVHHDRDEVGLALPDRAGDQGIVALVELVAERDLDGGHPVGAHREADAISTGLRPESIQRLHLTEGHWLHLRIGDRRGNVSANRDEVIGTLWVELPPHCPVIVIDRKLINIAQLRQVKNLLVDLELHGVDEKSNTSSRASLEQNGELVLDLVT